MKHDHFAIVVIMPCPKSEKAAESEEKVLKALAGIQSYLYQNLYHAAQKTGAAKHTIERRLNGGKTRAEA